MNAPIIQIRASAGVETHVDGLHDRLRSLNENVSLLSRLVTSLVPADLNIESDREEVPTTNRARVICISTGYRS